MSLDRTQSRHRRTQTSRKAHSRRWRSRLGLCGVARSWLHCRSGAHFGFDLFTHCFLTHAPQGRTNEQGRIQGAFSACCTAGADVVREIQKMEATTLPHRKRSVEELFQYMPNLNWHVTILANLQPRLRERSKSPTSAVLDRDDSGEHGTKTRIKTRSSV
jgi:hypothetical protein